MTSRSLELPASVRRDLADYAEILAPEPGQPISDPVKLIAPRVARFSDGQKLLESAARASSRQARGRAALQKGNGLLILWPGRQHSRAETAVQRAKRVARRKRPDTPLLKDDRSAKVRYVRRDAGTQASRAITRSPDLSWRIRSPDGSTRNAHGVSSQCIVTE